MRVWIRLGCSLCLILFTAHSASCTVPPQPDVVRQRHLSQKRCPDLPAAGIDAWIESKSKVVFFASWCGSCRDHLAEARGDPGVGLVVAFDDPVAAGKALVALGIPNACVVSPGLMQRFGVKALPFSVEIKELSLDRGAIPAKDK